MTGLTSSELTKMRSIADDFLPDTCTIQTLTDGVDALGGISKVFTSTYTGVACRLDPQGFGNEGVPNAALEAVSSWVLNIPYNQAIAVNNRVVHGSKTYEVTSVVDTNSYVTIRRALLKRVN